MKKAAKQYFLTVRVTKETHEKFHRKADAYSYASDVLSELVTAFLEDRLVIQPPKNRKESLYVS